VGDPNAQYVTYVTAYGVKMDNFIKTDELERAVQKDMDDTVQLWYGSNACRYVVDIDVFATGESSSLSPPNAQNLWHAPWAAAQRSPSSDRSGAAVRRCPSYRL
jgi:hypothetical protein